MASASSSSARTLFSDSKRRLAERVQVNVQNAASVARQIVRGSRSSEVFYKFYLQTSLYDRRCPVLNINMLNIYKKNIYS